MHQTPSTPDPALIRTTSVFVHALTGRTVSACPAVDWRAHLDAWRHARRHGATTAAEPMPWGHLLFERPLHYGYVPWGNTNQELRRTAITVSVRSSLESWDRGVDQERLEKIVAATVNNSVAGKNPGALPFLACLVATADL